VSGLWAMLSWAGLALLGVALVLGAMLGGDLRHVVFAEPLWLLAVLVPIAALGWRQWRAPGPATLRFSRATSLRRIGRGVMARLAHMPDGFRLAAGILLAVALARPQSTRGSDVIKHEGIDIVVVLDLSESMDAPDMLPNRLHAAQVVIDDFISRRPRDRIGLVVFGATASTVSPLTVDHGVLRSLVRRLRLGVIDGSMTAIGAGLGVALNRLKESVADSQVIVLLTDGVHNADGLDPDSAANEATDRGIKIYTVLMGDHRQGSDMSVDPSRLERIASVTGGYAYLAQDQDALSGSFQDLLDKLERSTVESQKVRPELFGLLLWPVLVLLGLDIGLRTTRLRRFP
jgi:Ca-activated chloride channel homolog